MRLYIHADTQNKPMFQFPWDYHLSLTSFVYDCLSKYDEKLASQLHQSENPPPFSFSNFMQTGPFRANDKGLLFTRGYLSVSSIDSRIVEAVRQYLLEKESSLKIGHTDVPVVGQTVENVTGESGTVTYETLSPIALGEQPYSSDQGTREWYLPSDPMWSARLRENVRKMKKEREGLPEEFMFRVKDYNWVDKKVKRLTEDVEVPCARMSLDIEADEQTSEFIQKFGVGERTGLGFGNIIRKQDMPQKHR